MKISKLCFMLLLFFFFFCNSSLSRAENSSDYTITTNENGQKILTVTNIDKLREQCEKNGVALEEVIDPDDPTIVLDVDDLANMRENRDNSDVNVPELDEILSPFVLVPLDGNQEVSKLHTIAVNGNGGGKAMQTFCYGSDGYLYITQNTKGDVTISRYSYNSSSGQYVYKDSMLITRAGHAQTLEQYTYEGTTYLLVTLGNIQIGEDYWSRHLGRVEYKPNGSIDNTYVEKYTELAYANPSQSSFGATKRVDAALSDDKSEIVIWKKNTKNQVEITGYNFSDFNYELSKSNTYDVSLKNNVTLRCTFHFTDQNDSTIDFPDSFQGIDFSNKPNGSKTIYIAGGNENPSVDGKAMMVASYTSNGNLKKSIGILHSCLPGLKEIEGIHLNGYHLNLGLAPTATSDKKTQHIVQVSITPFQ